MTDCSPRGGDPLNYNGPAARDAQQRWLIDAMEAAWRSCIRSTTPKPSFIIVTPAFAASWYEHLATPDRGHEFLPYG